MAYTFGEGLVDAVVSHLETDLPTVLSAIATDRGDSIALPAPVLYSRRDPTINQQAVLNTPAVYALVPRTTIANWHHGSAMQSHSLFIYLVDKAPLNDLEGLRKRIYRYGVGLWTSLENYNFTADRAWNIGVGEGGGAPVLDFGAILTAGSMAMADVRVEVVCDGFERRTV